MDNNYSMFDAYRNQYWPADFLVDATGQVRYFSLGEGNYQTTETHLRQLLQAANPTAQLAPPTTVADRTVTDPRTNPETYLNAGQIRNYTGTPLVVGKPQQYRFPTLLPPNGVSFDGNWTVGYQEATAGPNARIGLRYHASSVNLVIGGEGSITVDDGVGPDRTIAVSGIPRLYPLLAQPQPGDGQLTITLSPGLTAYDLTFG